MHLPDIALSVRQPWAWAIIYAGKPLENRSAKAVSFMVPLQGRRAIHAAKGMTRDEYESARDFMRELGVECPAPADLRRGGIIGSVEVTGVIKESQSQWFFGPRALVLADPRPCDFMPVVGALGYFKWKPAASSIVPPPARWMLPKAEPVPVAADRTQDLFGAGS
ncbi:MAG: hypothetical protein GC182_03100 [Rhodopseudomonas sp.]|nr:hypothetical protein [Rhodopseudomonas sp.]